MSKPSGTTIRVLRRRKGMTLEQLARRAGVSEKTLRLLERDQTDTPHPETISAIAGSLGVAPERLFEPFQSNEIFIDEGTLIKPSKDRQPSAHSELGEPLAFIVVRDEQRRLLSRYRIVHQQTTIGRSVDNIINLSDALVSEYHAIIHLVGTHLQIRDLGSLNGIYVNGSRVNGRADIQWGDDIAIAPFHVELLSPHANPEGFPIHETDLMTRRGKL